MKLSTRGRYGTRLMVDLARHYGEGPVQIGEIAKHEAISVVIVGMGMVMADMMTGVPRVTPRTSNPVSGSGGASMAFGLKVFHLSFHRK